MRNCCLCEEPTKYRQGEAKQQTSNATSTLRPAPQEGLSTGAIFWMEGNLAVGTEGPENACAL